MNFVMSLTLMASLLVFLAASPFAMALGLIFLTFLSGLLMSLLFSKWLSLALILIYIGGMMVVFIYTTSLSPNTKLPPMKLTSVMGALPLALLCVCPVPTFPPLCPNALFSNLNTFILLYLVFYLLLTLFIVSKVTETFKGALCQKVF